VKKLGTKIVIALLVLAVAGGGFALGTHFNDIAKASSGSGINSSGVVIPADTSSNTLTAIYTAASPAVVEIETTQQGNSFFGSTQGEGSGFLIDNQGDILTNNHVVQGSTSVQVLLSNGKTVNGKVLGTDSTHDLAIVNIDASAVSSVTPLKLVDSSTVQPGETVVAIGSPYGLTNSITAGIISGINRSVSGSSMTGMLQTDAAINPGNSGGPLLDMTGAVIGINTAIEDSADGGIGFAIPSNLAKNQLDNLIAGKTIVRPMIGISGLDITQANASSLGLSVNQGVYVVSVVSNGPADKAGIKAGNSTTSGTPGTGGDVITGVDGQTITTIEQLSTYIATKNVGDTVNLTILRGTQTLTVSVTLVAFSNSTVTPSTPNNQNPSFPNMPRGNQRNGNGSSY